MRGVLMWDEVFKLQLMNNLTFIFEENLRKGNPETSNESLSKIDASFA